MDLFYLYGLVFLVLVGQAEDIVIASLDGEALLSCVSEVKRDGCHRLRWVKYVSGVRSILLSRPKTLTFPDAERVQLRPDGNGNYSLSLTKLQKSDEGVYSCEIWSGWNCVDVRNTSLTIKECKILQAVKAVPGTSVNLSCPLDEAGATQRGATNASWAMLKAAKPVKVTSEGAKVNGPLLSFRAVGKKDFSWYRCNYTQEHAQRCYDINLQVQGQDLPSGTESKYSEEKEVEAEVQLEAEVQRSRGPAAAAVTVVLLAVATTAALAGFFVHRRRSRIRSRSRTRSHSRQTAAQKPPTGADLGVYWNCDNTDCAVYNRVSIYQDFPANPTGQ